MASQAPIWYRFVILAIGYLYAENYVKVRLQTPFVCHLFLHYTSHAIRKHPLARTIRGLTVPWGVYFCFTGYQTVEQEEVGDSLIHTFTIPDWPICETRNMIPTGTVAGVESPSCGPIITHHNPGPGPPSSESQTTGIVWSSILDWASWGQKLTISNRTLTNLAFYLRRFGAPAGEVRYRIRRFSDGLVLWDEKLMDSIDISTTAQWYGLAIDPPMLFNDDYRLEATATNDGAGNLINIYASPVDVKPDEHLYFRRFDGVYTEHTSRDFMYIYTYTPGWLWV